MTRRRESGPGLREVARRARVSAATASRALSGSPVVSRDTRDRVLSAADELGYQRPVPTPVVAIVARYPQHWFFAEAIGSIEETLSANGYRVLLQGLRDESSRRRFFGSLPSSQLDAMVVVATAFSAEEQAALTQLGIPIVVMGASLPGYTTVGIDEEAAARTATEHLIGLGHREIGLISFEPADPVAAQITAARRHGFEQALLTNGLAIVPEWIIVAEGSRMAGGGRAAEQLLTRPRLPTALFTMSDELAVGVLRAVRRAGLSVPGHLSVVGFDDHEMAEFVDLTTIRQAVSEQARTAAALLGGAEHDPVRTPAPDTGPTGVEQVSVDLPVRLVVRGTTGPPR